MISIGILSDTHLTACTPEFQADACRAFSGCEMIIHAGDLTDTSILEAFAGKIVHAVQGNTCNFMTRQNLPMEKTLTLEGNIIGICHGAGPRASIEERVWNLFPHADCIIFGHTHEPLCTRRGKTLFINPGSFRSTGPFGSPATYAILTVAPEGLQAKIFSLSQS
ncbi:MAG: metallophosphoesterase family protein [Desulfocapsaceae bacterium]|nr:metallophosphoesterase family protein [Desulfocapsaceae bacterium]